MTMFHAVVTSTPDSQGRQSFTMFWVQPDSRFRPDLGPDGIPVGYHRAQCFKAVVDEVRARHVAAGHGFQVWRTEQEAEKAAWPALTPELRAKAIAELRWTLTNTGIYGSARESTEKALAWLEASDG